MKIFLLKRLYGLGQIVDGICYLFTGRSFRLGLKAARQIARERGKFLSRPSERLLDKT